MAHISIQLCISEGEKTMMYYLCFKLAEEAAEYYSSNLNSESGKSGTEYLINRNINEDSIKRFNLG